MSGSHWLCVEAMGMSDPVRGSREQKECEFGNRDWGRAALDRNGKRELLNISFLELQKGSSLCSMNQLERSLKTPSPIIDVCVYVCVCVCGVSFILLTRLSRKLRNYYCLLEMKIKMTWNFESMRTCVLGSDFHKTSRMHLFPIRHNKPFGAEVTEVASVPKSHTFSLENWEKA